MGMRGWAVVVVLASAAGVAGCAGNSTGAARTVTVTSSADPSPVFSPEPEVTPSPEFVADEDAFYDKAIIADKSLAGLSRETVTGYGWNLCSLESMDDGTDPMYKNLLGPARSRGTLAAAHTYLCPDQG